MDEWVSEPRIGIFLLVIHLTLPVDPARHPLQCPCVLSWIDWVVTRVDLGRDLWTEHKDQPETVPTTHESTCGFPAMR